MDKIQPLFTATATSVGGRNGHTESSDHIVSADLSVPKAMGGPGKPGTATPEHLFAAGYAACFGGALDFVGKQHKQDAAKAKITCAVSIGPREGGGFGIAVKLRVEDKPEASRSGGADPGSTRKDLPLFPRHARQCRRAA
jgi:osmotically inducible protein OsmC